MRWHYIGASALYMYFSREINVVIANLVNALL